MPDNEQIWAQIRKIRDSWGDSEQLKVALAEWESDFGTEYNTLAEEILAKKTRESWARRAASWNSTSLDVLMRVMWEDWTEGEFSIDKSEGRVQIQCTKCPIAEVYRSIGQSELGLIFQLLGIIPI
jgi:hypothetical protein